MARGPCARLPFRAGSARPRPGVFSGEETLRAGLALLVAAYVLSQFYRAFLAVLSPVLGPDIGAGADDLARASGLWFAAFALMQLPVGAALDRIGPRRTAAALLAIGGGGGAAIFALAQGPGAVSVAMVLIGIGCSPVLMASYYIFARLYSPAIFGTLAASVIGIGSLGNILSAEPLAWAVGLVGWRGTLWALAAVTLANAAALWLFLRDPPAADRPEGAGDSVLALLRMPAIWPILPLMAVAYAPSAALRGLWAGPYAETLFGAGPELIGRMTLAMGLAMIVGSFAYGPLDRLLRTRKWVVFGGNAAAAASLAALWALPAPGLVAATALLCAIGFFGASFPAIMAHGRAFFPPHMVGRGVTFLNMFGIGGAGIMQFASGPVYAASGGAVAGEAAFDAVFLFFLVPLVLGLVLYLLSQDRAD